MAAKRYYIISEFSLRDLEERVNAAIVGDGAFPVGGVSTSWELGWRLKERKSPRYYQSVLQWKYGLRRKYHQAMLDFPDEEPPKTEDSE